MVRDLLALGVAGFVSKATSKNELAHAISEVLNGSVYLPERFRDINQPQPSEIERGDMLRRLQDLTPQQLRVLDMIRAGLQNKQIAYELGVAETTVKAHVSEILRKLNVYSRTKAAIEVGKMDFAQFSADSHVGGDKPRRTELLRKRFLRAPFFPPLSRRREPCRLRFLRLRRATPPTSCGSPSSRPEPSAGSWRSPAPMASTRKPVSISRPPNWPRPRPARSRWSAAAPT